MTTIVLRALVLPLILLAVTEAGQPTSLSRPMQTAAAIDGPEPVCWPNPCGVVR